MSSDTHPASVHPQVTDVNVVSTITLPSPSEMRDLVPESEAQAQFVSNSREEIEHIIFGADSRFLVVVGPCSIHDVDAGFEYAKRLKALSDQLSDRLCIVMRAYFEKPRTSIGWKGLIMDPELDGTCDLKQGLQIARRFLSQLIELGVPTATELLDPITPQYIGDLICWSAIGARTTESQTHRQMASGLSMPLGFKNSTDGTMAAAINAIKAARQTQTFLGINKEGISSAITTRGNTNCHLVVRGGFSGPNYAPEFIQEYEAQLQKAGLKEAIMVDASHANSEKNHENQTKVLESIIEQIEAGNQSIIGAMIESNLNAGNQKFPQPRSELQHGVSITDACIDWDTTVTALHRLYDGLAPRFA
ncbi:MAG: 3-deoxy-7-phosphoheptulonate synthase [Verrucomicrobia bacterium]|nr:3-deoxy-7-phosphoheptulonate synthase [Verrucomicrobiota bacterium]